MSAEIAIDQLRTWVGKQDRESDFITPELLKCFRATLIQDKQTIVYRLPAAFKQAAPQASPNPPKTAARWLKILPDTTLPLAQYLETQMSARHFKSLLFVPASRPEMASRAQQRSWRVRSSLTGQDQTQSDPKECSHPSTEPTSRHPGLDKVPRSNCNTAAGFPIAPIRR